MIIGVALTFAAVLVGCALTGAIRAYAVRSHLLDVPNERSSHDRPTPRGGGLSIVVNVLLACVVLGALGAWREATAIALAGGAIAGVGWVDDRRGVAWYSRLLVHVAASTAIALTLDPCRAWGCTDGTTVVVSALAVVLLGAWAINLFNFMDGIDGIAGQQAVFVAFAAAWLGARAGSPPEPVWLLLVVGGSSLGFLVWNTPPARIFMGDVGSGFLGFMLFAGPLWLSTATGAALWAWMILWATFASDASATLLRRWVRGERLYEAHRSHLYQRLALRWGAHAPVSLLYFGVNLCWCLPLAVVATDRPEWSVWAAVAAYAPLVGVAWFADRLHPTLNA